MFVATPTEAVGAPSHRPRGGEAAMARDDGGGNGMPEGGPIVVAPHVSLLMSSRSTLRHSTLAVVFKFLFYSKSC